MNNNGLKASVAVLAASQLLNEMYECGKFIPFGFDPIHTEEDIAAINVDKDILAPSRKGSYKWLAVTLAIQHLVVNTVILVPWVITHLIPAMFVYFP